MGVFAHKFVAFASILSASTLPFAQSQYKEAAVLTAGASDASGTSGSSDCMSPPHPGNPRCTGWRNLYYFNMRTRSCELFTYSGCSGNGNRFETRYSCEETCIRQRVSTGANTDRLQRQKAGFKLPTDYNPNDDLQYYGAANPDFYQKPNFESDVNDDRRAGFKLPAESAGVVVAAGPVSSPPPVKQQQTSNNNGGLRVMLNRILSNILG